MSIVAPVTKEDSSEAKKATTFATSSGFPNLPRQVKALAVSLTFSGKGNFAQKTRNSFGFE